jgi:sulfur-carrier protein
LGEFNVRQILSQHGGNMRVLFFAQLRLAVGSDAIELAVEQSITGAGLWEQLIKQYPALQQVSGPIRLAVNQEFVDWMHGLQDDQEIAFIPPVSGG